MANNNWKIIINLPALHLKLQRKWQWRKKYWRWVKSQTVNTTLPDSGYGWSIFTPWLLLVVALLCSIFFPKGIPRKALPDSGWRRDLWNVACRSVRGHCKLNSTSFGVGKGRGRAPGNTLPNFAMSQKDCLYVVFSKNNIIIVKFGNWNITYYLIICS